MSQADRFQTAALVERARSHAIWARGRLLDYEAGGHHLRDLVRARRLLVAASQALGTAAMDSTLSAEVTKTLVDSWAGLDAFLLAAGEVEEDTSRTGAQQLLTRATTFLIETLPSRPDRAPVSAL